MPRRSRMYIPGFPFHLVQRGNNRNDCFFETEDFQHYQELLSQYLGLYGVSLHAYVLMTNHIHLLVTPEAADSVSRLTRVVGSRYAQYINRKYRRTGTLWEGRHKSSPVDSESYLLKCYRYIELNPVRAHMVARPEDYPWSSYHANACNRGDEILTPHDIYLRLGASAEKRCLVYRDIVKPALSEEDMHAIRSAAHFCQPLGGPRFRNMLETRLEFSAGQAGSGRPRNCS